MTRLLSAPAIGLVAIVHGATGDAAPRASREQRRADKQRLREARQKAKGIDKANDRKGKDKKGDKGGDKKGKEKKRK